ncbi:hypothetical protein FACS1894111_04940 [Clostridia bacterium]|nr:hypothetical protein FACS1894111_04940 [Clostridia bacterium]
MFRRINPVLPELLCNIVLFGFIVQISGVWFAADKLRYSSGLWLGVIVAMAIAVHMSVLILDAVDLRSERPARIRTTIFSILRYFVVILIFVGVAYFRLGNIIVMMIGVMGLKAASHFYPFTHKIYSLWRERSLAKLGQKEVKM